MNAHHSEISRGVHLNENLQLYFEISEKTILYEGSEEFCYQLERILRPDFEIGWNLAIGNSTQTKRSGYKMSKEFKEQRHQSMLGNSRGSGNRGKPKSPIHRQRIAEANKGRSKSKESKIRQSEKMRGRKLTPEHRAKISQQALGKKRGPYRVGV